MAAGCVCRMALGLLPQLTSEHDEPVVTDQTKNIADLDMYSIMAFSMYSTIKKNHCNNLGFLPSNY
jgi:hypothetical protein